ncbi:cell division site-positioning protein MapZ family protein [Pseudolactococcus yaeyamensis]
MAKKKKKTAYKEKTMAMKDAENLTVEQVSVKSDEIETENLTKESPLDKYIRQHRSDIESVKKERQLKAAVVSESLDKFVQTAREAASAESETVVAPEDEVESETVAASENEVTSENDAMPSDLKAAVATTDEVDSGIALESESAPEPDISEMTESAEGIEPDFPEIQGSFDTVVLVADDDKQVSGEPTVSEKSDEIANYSEVIPLTDTTVSESQVIATETVVESETPVESAKPETTEMVLSAQDWSIESLERETQSHQKPLIIGVCALLLLAVGGTVWYQVDQSNQKQAAQTAKSEAKKSEEAKKTAAFNKVYATFFVDDKATKLKNDQFDNIGKLTSELDKLKDQSDYKTLKAKVDELKSEITAIKAMNGNFDKAIITNGALDKTAQVREGVKLSYTATENVALNTLLKDAVAHGQAQQKAKSSVAPAPSTPAPIQQPTAPENTTTAPQQSGSATATADSSTGPVSSGYGLSTAQYQAQYPNVIIVTSNSRVPVDPNADLSNPAYAWAPGIRELVLQKCRERGYITGDAYILLPASIQKGNGYYNLYKPDGTYLVSINCKTGYFVGNAAGHADDLDY